MYPLMILVGESMKENRKLTVSRNFPSLNYRRKTVTFRVEKPGRQDLNQMIKFTSPVLGVMDPLGLLTTAPGNTTALPFSPAPAKNV